MDFNDSDNRSAKAVLSQKSAKAQLLHSVRGVPPYAKVKLSDAGIRQFC